ncbi:hypothetical protein IFVP195_C1120049 [Vibrio parahaemolyticus]
MIAEVFFCPNFLTFPSKQACILAIQKWRLSHFFKYCVNFLAS